MAFSSFPPIGKAHQAGASAIREKAWFVEDGGWELETASNQLSFTLHGKRIVEKIFGFIPSSPREVWSALRREDAEKAARLVESLDRDQRDVAQFILPLTCADGTTTTVCIRAVTRYDDEGILKRISGTISENVEAMPEAESLEFRSLRLLAANSTDLILHLDRGGTIRYASPQTARYFDLAAQSLEGKRLAEAGLDKSVAGLIGEKIQEIRDTRLPAAGRVTFLGATGRMVCMDLRLWPELNTSGALSSVLVQGSDVTIRQRTEQSYFSLFSSLLYGFALFETLPSVDNRNDLPLLLMNRGFQDMLGLRPDATGKPLDVLFGRAATVWKNIFAAVMRNGRPHFSSLAVENGQRYLEVAAYSPEPHRLACIVRDITDIRQAERRDWLHQSRLASLYTISRLTDSAGDDGTIASFALQEVVRLTGSRTGCLFLASPNLPRDTIFFWDTAAQEGDSDTREHCLVSLARKALFKGAEQMEFGIFEDPAALAGYPLRARRLLTVPVTERGNLRCLALLAEKPTPYEEYEFLQIRLFLAGLWESMRTKWVADSVSTELAAARDATQAGKDFLHVLSHEIRGPLTNVSGMLQMLDMSRLDSEQKEYADTAMNSVRALMRTLGEAADFTRLDGREVSLTSKPFSPLLLCQQIRDQFVADAASRELNFCITPAEDLPDRLVGDEGRIRQIVAHLVSNALKFTSKGSIVVDCWTSPHPDAGSCRLYISVTDTGIGIPEEKLGGVFSAYRTLSSGGKLYPGIGLGLAISSNLVKLLGGTLCIASQSGEGTAVFMGLVLDEPALDQNPSALAKARDLTPSLHILLVEDDAVNRFTVLSLLRHLGHSVTCVDNGHEALDMLQGGKEFDCILSDIEMPVMDGIELASRFRDYEHNSGIGRTIPMLAITAHALEGDKERFLKAGFDYYIAKPVALDDLLTALKWVEERIRA